MYTIMFQLSSKQTLEEYLEKKVAYWLEMVNKNYATDYGETIRDFSRGALAACTEMLALVKEIEDE